MATLDCSLWACSDRAQRAEWDRAWACLAEVYDWDHESPCGERWQYMGSEVRFGSIRHTFRHRDYHGQRVYWSCLASIEWECYCMDRQEERVVDAMLREAGDL